MTRHHQLLCLLLAWGGLPAASIADREQTISGTAADETPKVFITVKGDDALAGCEREYLADVTYPPGAGANTAGTWSQKVRYYPGGNTVTIHSATGPKTRNPQLVVDPPALRVRLEWAGNDHDYDLYVNEVNWTAKVSPAGKLDRDAYAGSDTGPGVENITFDAAAPGTYQVFVNYYSNHGHAGQSDPTTVSIFLGGSANAIFTETYTLTTAEAHGGSLAGDGKSVWNVATVVVHGSHPGGYRVVDKDWKEAAFGFRDIFLGKDDKPLVVLGGKTGVFPRTDFQVGALTGPNGADRVVMAIGQSAQLVATGTANAGSGNAQARAILGHFHSSAPAVALVDDFGVVTGVAGGKATITTDQGSGSIDVHVFDVRLSADTDRGGSVAAVADRPLKEVWSRRRGAIYAVNYDDSDSDHHPDVIAFDDTGAPTDEHLVIKAVDDVSPLLINKLGTPLPAGAAMFLKAGAADQVRAMHFYKERKVGEAAIWGGLTAAAAPTPAEIDISAWLKADQDAQPGLEGLLFRNTGAVNPFPGYLELTMELRDRGTVIKADTVRLKVAPWLILPNTQPSQQAWMWDSTENATSRLTAAADPGYVGVDDSHQLRLGSVPADGRWLQDHLEYGYTQRPGGPKTLIVFRLPYFRGAGSSQPSWPLADLVGPGVGVFQLGVHLAGGGSGDYGGNLEALPPDAATYRLGRIVLGDTGSGPLRDFLASQEVQRPVFTAPVQWLAVGHVDEVVSFLPGNRIAVADPEAAWGLLTAIAPADRNAAVFFATGGAPAGGVVGTVVNAAPGGMRTRLYDGPAVGRITAVADNLLADGETVTIADRAGHQVVFEFDKNGAVAAGHAAIAIPPLPGGAVRGADAMRDLIIAAVNGSGLTVKAVANGAATVHLWNSVKGVAGNQAVAETVANAGFAVQGMELGRAGGTDFTGRVGWGYVRTHAFAAGPPAVASAGATAEVVGWQDGYLEIAQVWSNGSRLVDGVGAERDHAYWSEHLLATTATYPTLPGTGSRYVLCQGSLRWRRGAPAIVTVEEVLADKAFEDLNRTDVQGVIAGAAGSVRRVLTDAAAAAPAFVPLPCLFFGHRTGFAIGRSCVAFNPGPTNLQQVAGALYVPRQFGPRNAAGADIFEASIATGLPGARFVDVWSAYHCLKGELHCGTAMKRDAPALDWWANTPEPAP